MGQNCCVLAREKERMRLVRYGEVGAEKPGILDNAGRIRDLSQQINDIGNDVLTRQGLAKIAALDTNDLPLVSGQPRLGPCVAETGKILAIGLNYALHIAETNSRKRDEPMLFQKATSAISGPYDPIVRPKTSTKLDWEVELAVVIGDRALNITEAEAPNHIAGYCIINDVSERGYQADRSGQFTKGKSADTFAPLGPWLVTSADVDDPNNLTLWTKVNGVQRQHGNTQDMISQVYFLVSYLSEFMTLYPGDIIATGTPSGVGVGMSPQLFLQPGDTVEMGIDGLGQQRCEVVQG